MNIRAKKPGDEAAIREVNRLAFERGDEARLVDALRDGGFVRLSPVGEVSADGVSKSLALAPVAVAPDWQGVGVGSALIEAGVKASAAEGHNAIFVLGEPGYYSRFGFSTETAKSLETPYPKEYFMALELADGALRRASGRIEYPPPFGGG